MNDKQQRVLVPRYLEQFACIGSNCEDTCCVGWKVIIDQTTYKKYEKVRDVELKPILDKKITRNRSNPNVSNYAKIKLDNDGRCPILNEDSLCKVQLKLGESYLSDTCSNYPRVTNQTNGVLERSANISCPEIARLALLNPNGLELIEIEEPVTTRNTIAKTLDSNNPPIKSKQQRYFRELRLFTIQVLQNRQYDLADRLIILGMFVQKLNELIAAKDIDMIPQLVADYTRYMDEGVFIDSLSGIPVQYAIQMELVKELADERVFLGINNNRYLESFGQFLHGIEYNEGATVEEIAERYNAAYTNYYKPFMTKYEYMMENYLVNFVYKNMFPFSGYPTVADEYMVLVIHYAIIKLLLIGISGHHKEEFNQTHVIQLMQSFSKTVEHNPLYVKYVSDILKKNEYTSMAYMAILIKN